MSNVCRSFFKNAIFILAACTLIGSVATVEGDEKVESAALLLVSVQTPGQDLRTVALDRQQLKNIGVHKIRTSTVWTDGGARDFEGVLMRDLQRFVGASHSTSVTASALNDYKIEIPTADFEEYDVIVAWQMDENEFAVRDKGPFWIIYPRDQFSKLQDERYDQRWVWQLNRLEFK